MSETGLPMADFGPDTTRSLETLMGEGIPVCNPLDAWTIDDTVGSYLRIFQAIADSGEFDVLALQLDQTPFTGEIEIQVGLQLLEALIEATADKPVAPVMISGQSSESVAEIRHLAERHDVPLLRASEFAIRALARVSRWADRTIVWDAGRDSGPPASTVHLGEFRSSQILSAAGIRFPERELADSADEAVAAARRIGLPVVLKSNEIAHRSAVSAVTLGLKTLAGVAAEFDALEGPVIVASQVAAGPELYIGGRHDGRFGPIVCVGWGGQALEHRDNVSCALAPLTREAALSLTGSIAGLREVAPDELIESFVDVILATATFLESSQVGTAVDMNPVVLVAGRGAIALDALVVPGEG
jgi:acyl-CoA synthetase (NDP forming)